MKLKTTIHHDEILLSHQQMKATEARCSISGLVNQADKEFLIEDQADIQEWEKRKSEPEVSLRDTIKELKINWH